MFDANPKTTNLAGNPKLTEVAPREAYKRADRKAGNRKGEPNPRHYEDFNRLLGGMARSSE